MWRFECEIEDDAAGGTVCLLVGWKHDLPTYSKEQSPSLTYSKEQSPSLTYSKEQSPSLTYSKEQSPSLTNSKEQSPSLTYSKEQSPSLTPRSRVPLEQLTGFQLVKKFPLYYGTRMFITAFTRACHLSLSWASSIQSLHPHPASWRSILTLWRRNFFLF
jgi:hypothetical protein